MRNYFGNYFFFGGGINFFSMVSIEIGKVSGGGGPVTLSTAKKLRIELWKAVTLKISELRS